MTSDGDGVVRVRPEVMTWPRRRRAPSIISGVIKTKKEVAWENDPIEIPCYKPQFFVVWKFTQNQTIKVMQKKARGYFDFWI